ncbi:MAG: primosomal protein N' [Deltaproteobacteria bacterium]|jgi:primosomal protein N' (replication factor Y)|nr:primosomal protein N' [Deltaproteobacteria bacterium]
MMPVKKSPSLSADQDISQTIYKVAVDAPAPDIYDYLPPKGVQVRVGQMVMAPFGGRQLLGYVMSCGPVETGCRYKLKTITKVIVEEPLFGQDFFELVNFISYYYIYPPGLCVKEILPGGLGPKLKPRMALTDKGILEGPQLEGNLAKAYDLLLETHPEPRLLKDLSGLGEVPQRLCKEGLAEKIYHVDNKGAGFAYEFYLAPAPDPDFRGRIGPKEKILWELVKGCPPTPISHYRNLMDNPMPQAKSLAAKGLIVIESREKFRDDPNRALNFPAENIGQLTSSQAASLDKILAAITSKEAKGFLLFGVTGSGKTEVYLRAAQAVLERGQGVLWLAPEIALTMGLEGRLKERFPAETISVLHSRLTAGQRHDHWLALCRGNRKMALGARSAVFAPIQDLGLVIVDEEHDWAYKQDDGLRYNGRDLAAWRAQKSGAVLILGSATPSLESYHRASIGKLELLTMGSRPGRAELPEVIIVDRRDEPKGLKHAIADEVRESLKETFERGEQALMFINRRGTANLPMCLACGEALKCPHCNLSLTLHSKIDGFNKTAPEEETHGNLSPDSLLVCHSCGYRAKPPSCCPNCGSYLVRYFGVGTESLIKIVERDFGKKGLRLDTDSTKLKGGLKDILERFAQREADFLVGTQMAAKGHDFSLLTMVGVVEADLGINVPDFRASERTFQLLSQVSGRAGRRERPGKVFIQTRLPEHYAMVSAKNHDFETFYQNEIKIRQDLSNPPFSRLALIRVSGLEEPQVSEWANMAADKARELIEKVGLEYLDLIGPAPSPMTKLREKYRYQMMLRAKTHVLRHKLLNLWLPAIRKLLPGGLVLTVDVDPYSLL